MEELKLGNKYNGFVLKRIERVDDIDSEVLIFEHEITGARVLNIKNNDDDKTFAIGFRTPPFDDTGLPHILEHSVLNGSKNFPIKDPFAELARSTIHTFMNAFTFPDKTVYPFSTQNDKEFSKMMNVYLDSVFYPLIYDKKAIFLQEGWRFELDDANDSLEYSGVVYSEMKGANSSPQRIIENTFLKNLFPNNCYRHSSGGEPKAIPDLTYEKFLDFHKKYYHPSNSFIYVYGDTDILKHLKFIEENYLKNFDRENIDSTISYQSKIDGPIEIVEDYPISCEEDSKNKAYLHINTLVCKNSEQKLCLSFEILEEILLGMSASPLKQALLDSNIGENVYGKFDRRELIQPLFWVTIQNTDPDKKTEFERIYFDTLKNLKNEGINKDLIKAAINKKEFEYREAIDKEDNFGEGIKYAIDIFTTWLYDEDPTIKLKYKDYFKEIKSLSTGNYFEDLIDKYLINNEHRLTLTLNPNPNINLDEEVSDKLKKIKNNLSQEDINKIKEDKEILRKFQEEEDREEDIAKIKPINIKNIDRLPKKIELDNKKLENDGELFFHKANTKGITYIDLLFDARFVSADDISYLSLIESLLKEAKTKNYDYESWSNLVNINTGGLNFVLRNITTEKDLKLIPKFCIETKVLNENTEKIPHILEEITNNCLFEKSKIKEVILRLKSKYEIKIVENGHMLAFLRTQAMASDSGKYSEITRGISYYKFLCDLANNFELKSNEIIEKLNGVYKKVFNKKNLIMSVTSDIENTLDIDRLNIPNREVSVCDLKFKIESFNEAFKTTSQVVYVCKGNNYRNFGFEPSGELLVLNNYLRYKYLWENVRLKGGAYGGGGAIRQDGSFSLFSYRDPRLKGTLQDYDNLATYLEKLDLKEEEVRKFIIGAVGDLDEPLKPHEEGFKATIEYIKGIDYNMLKKEREEVLDTDSRKLSALSSLVCEVINKNGNICVIGNSSLIDKEKDIFNKIERPLE
jgi:hypothetical protein